MLAWIPPVWLPWTALLWATAWTVWAAVDSWLPPRADLARRIALVLHLLFALQWLAFNTLQIIGVWSRHDYLDFVAPYAPIVYALGPWAIWPAKHFFLDRRSERARRVEGWSWPDDKDGER